MEYIYLKARAKINLTLEVLDKRLDNYHNIKSVFQRIDLYDDLYIYKSKTNEIEIKTNIEEINGENNIVYKAYHLLKEKYDQISGVKVSIEKRIPLQAGLGGGSADCASFLLGMNELFDLKMSKEELISFGRKLGADVVPCLYDKALLAEGIGDIITEIDTSFDYNILVVKPDISCNTKEMYEKLDNTILNKAILNLDNSKNVIKALIDNDIELLSKNLYNSFEQVVAVFDIKEELIKSKALNALLCGSGSCVFGIYKTKDDLIYSYNKLKDKYKVYMCSSYNK